MGSSSSNGEALPVSNGMDDFKWFIGFIFIVIAVWLGGRTAVDTAPSATTSPTTVTSPSTEMAGTLDQIETAEREVERLQEELKQAEIDRDASPLKGKLKIVNYSLGSTPDREYVLIQAPSTNKEPVLITGLTIGSDASLTKHSIPKAWPLPFLGAIGVGEPVFLMPGERAFLTSGKSPILLTTNPVDQTSFRLNKCTGFLGKGITVYPSLPTECPAPSSETLPTGGYELSYACVDYIRTIPRCTVPGPIPARLTGDSLCGTYISTKINYTECVKNHKDDEDFYRGEWRLYLGRSKTLWKSEREVMELKDSEGKLIDSRAY